MRDQTTNWFHCSMGLRGSSKTRSRTPQSPFRSHLPVLPLQVTAKHLLPDQVRKTMSPDLRPPGTQKDPALFTTESQRTLLANASHQEIRRDRPSSPQFRPQPLQTTVQLANSSDGMPQTSLRQRKLPLCLRIRKVPHGFRRQNGFQQPFNTNDP